MNTTDKLQHQAIQAALKLDWTSAIEINTQILEQNPEDIASLNRLAFAFTQQGQITKARTTYNQVLELDKFNPIAQKSIEKISKLKDSTNQKNLSQSSHRLNVSFIEEPGKTKSVTLIRPTTSSGLISLNPGTSVKLTVKKKSVTVESQEGEYIGGLPDDVGFRLARLIKEGYTYETLIKNCQNKTISVFIKELSKPQQSDTVSFPNSIHTRSFNNLDNSLSSSVEVIPIDITPTGEEDQEMD